MAAGSCTTHRPIGCTWAWAAATVSMRMPSSAALGTRAVECSVAICAGVDWLHRSHVNITSLIVTGCKA